MLENKEEKYTLNYTPDTNIPASVLSYVRWVVSRNPRMWVFLLVMDVIHGLRYPFAFFLSGVIIDQLTALDSPTDAGWEIWQNVLLIFAILFVGELCHAGPHYIAFDWWKRARAQLRADLLAYTLGHSFTYFQNHFAGSLSRKVSEGIEKGLMLQEQLRWQIFLPMVILCSSALVMINISLLYSGLVALFILVIIVPTLMKLRKIERTSRIFADACSDVSGQIVDTISNIASVKSYAREEQEMEEHRRVSEIQIRAWHKMLRAFLLLDNYRRATLVVFGAGMVSACILGWQSGILSIGDAAAIIGISFNFTATIWNLSFGIIHVSESVGYLNDSLTTLIKEHDVKDQEDAKRLQVSEACITFDAVDFTYKDKPVFDKLTLDIPGGQRVGLIGPSGAGKSTLINLIQRFFDLNDGALTIDGQDLRDVTQQSLRENIALIPQDTALFHRTLMENIRYGRLDASDEEVIEAARKAHAMPFIEELPEGFDTLVGERGLKLSGGQRQRIAIARAILKDAPILILDEATSALDSESEREIQAALEELMAGKTVIAIAHRLSTINQLDRLIVMDNGQIVEDGTHEELLEIEGGTYKRLWSMQSGGFLKD